MQHEVGLLLFCTHMCILEENVRSNLVSLLQQLVKRRNVSITLSTGGCRRITQGTTGGHAPSLKCRQRQQPLTDFVKKSVKNNQVSKALFNEKVTLQLC